tara:strand:- start:720 stop:1472 length:753 start_codon:yes stop_codon:yes gene_type:complete
MNHIIFILAGGDGKRMNSDLPKVLHSVNGLPMIIHVLDSAIQTNPLKIVIIVGKHYNQIKNTIESYNIFNIEYIIQENPMGTGHAVMCCNHVILQNINTNVLILNADVPLIKHTTLNHLIDNHNDVSLIVTDLDNPFGYGRIILDNNNDFLNIVEEKDCNDNEKKITTINSGIYIFKSTLLNKYLSKISNYNAQCEYYLTDLLKIIKNHEKNTHFQMYNLDKKQQIEILGVNNKEQLENIEKKFKKFKKD